MPPIARTNRVVAVDLPGFGASAKPVGIRYSFEFLQWRARRHPRAPRHR
jgi:pimeloyl-ACP methyl ester carboxylesterase